MVVLAIVALGVPLAFNLRDRVNAEVRSEARSQADVVAATAAGLLRPLRRADVERLVRTAAHAVRGRVIVVDSRGFVVGDSSGSAAGARYSGRPEVAAALSGRNVQRTRESSTLGEELLATAAPVLVQGRPAGAVRITQSVAAVGRAVDRSIAGIALLAGLVLLLGLVAGALIARQVARPLGRLEEAAEEIAGGDLSVRADVEGTREQRALARSFNAMTERLGRMLEGQREFVADASHQLRTPLTGLRLRLEEARVEAATDGGRRELDGAIGEVDRLSRIVAELLVLSRAGERDAPAEEVSLAETAERAAERWRHAAQAREIALTASSSRSGSAVCSREALDRAVDALVENAIAYSPSGTTVEVVAAAGNLSVLDRGPGLGEDEQELVLRRFHRGSAGRQGPAGTGLGLAIAQELASEWGGRVSIANREGGGACAQIALPPT